MSTLTLGILQLGEHYVALDTCDLQEVIRVSGRISPMPRAPAWSLGTVTLCDCQIPIVDLARLLGFSDGECARDAGRDVAIVAHGEGRVGLLIDQVCDVISVEEGELNTLGRGREATDALIRAMFARPGDERSIYVLNIEGLLGLDGMALVFNGTRQRTELDHGASAARTARHRVLILESDTLRLAVDAAVVREIAACTTFSEPVVSLPGYLGNQTLRADTVPVFDTRVLLGYTSHSSPPEQLLVLETGQGGLALGATRIVSIVDYSEDRCLSLPDGEAHTVRHVMGLLSIESIGDALLLAHEQLFAQETLTNLAHIHAQLNISEDKAAQRDAGWQRFAFMHFEAGGCFAVPLQQLDAVLTVPETYTPLNDGGLFEGVFRHLDRTVSLVDLPQLLGRPSQTRATQVLVVTCVGGAIGFMVEAARDIAYIEAPSDRLIIRRSGETHPQATGIAQCQRLISIGVGDSQQFLSVLCLETLAALLTRDPAVPCALAEAGLVIHKAQPA